jgi:hypothetical protein
MRTPTLSSRAFPAYILSPDISKGAHDTSCKSKTDTWVFSLLLKASIFSIATTDAQLEKPGIEESIGMIRLLYSKRGNGKK